MLLSLFISLIYSAIKEPHIIPQPQKIDIISKTEEDGWKIQNKMKIGYDSTIPDIENTVKYAINILQTSTGFEFTTTPTNVESGLYFGLISGDASQYKLETSNDLASIYGTDSTAIFYGFQTLLQLLPPEIYSDKTESAFWISQPLVSITDSPKFAWRGVMVDSSRHFFPVDVLKHLIDGMSHYKLNVLHLHLSDDQGWRLEVKKFPNLTKYGSVRSSSPQKWHRYISDNSEYGPFYYTESEISELVEYANARKVTIVPGIQLPGHAMSILSAFPQAACTSNTGPFVPSCFWTTSDDCVLCVGNDDAIDIIKKVLDEVIRIFSLRNGNGIGAFLHIGANDASRKKWKSCEKCSQRMKDEKLRNVDQLQSWFVMKISQFLQSRNIRVVGCDNLLDSKDYSLFDLPEGAVVMTWRSDGGSAAAAQQKHDVVVSPSDRLSLDFSQFNADDVYEYMGETQTTKMVYSYNPLEDLTDDLTRFVLGTQANLFSQFIWDESDLFYKAFPRVVALSETAWCDHSSKDWERFTRELEQSHFEKLRFMGFDNRKLSCACLSFSKDNFKSARWVKGDFSTEKWVLASFSVSGALNKYGQYEIAFIQTGGENSIRIRNVRLLVNNVIVSEDDHEGVAGNPGNNNFYSVSLNSSPNPEDSIIIDAEILAEDDIDSEGIVHIYPADLRN